MHVPLSLGGRGGVSFALHSLNLIFRLVLFVIFLKNLFKQQNSLLFKLVFNSFLEHTNCTKYRDAYHCPDMIYEQKYFCHCFPGLYKYKKLKKKIIIGKSSDILGGRKKHFHNSTPPGALFQDSDLFPYPQVVRLRVWGWGYEN